MARQFTPRQTPKPAAPELAKASTGSEVKLVVTRTFSAAHHLPHCSGECHRLHGHTWKVEVECVGPISPHTGMVVDFKDIKSVIDRLDHSYLNDVLDNPTAENVAVYLYNRILFCTQVKVWESDNCYVQCPPERRGICTK